MAGIDSTTKSILHCNGTNGSTSFPDSSFYPHAWAANGNASVDTAAPFFGTGCLRLDGSGDFLSTPDHADFRFGAGNFTIDARIAFSYLPSIIAIVYDKRANSPAYKGIVVYVDSTGKIGALASFDSATWGVSLLSSSALSAATYYHVAFVRNGNVWTLYLNGSSVATQTISGTVADDTSPVRIGSSADTYGMAGIFDEIRISNAALWTANFTPPASELTSAAVTAVSPISAATAATVAPTAAQLLPAPPARANTQAPVPEATLKIAEIEPAATAVAASVGPTLRTVSGNAVIAPPAGALAGASVPAPGLTVTGTLAAATASALVPSLIRTVLIMSSPAAATAGATVPLIRGAGLTPSPADGLVLVPSSADGMVLTPTSADGLVLVPATLG